MGISMLGMELKFSIELNFLRTHIISYMKFMKESENSDDYKVTLREHTQVIE